MDGVILPESRSVFKFRFAKLQHLGITYIDHASKYNDLRILPSSVRIPFPSILPSSNRRTNRLPLLRAYFVKPNPPPAWIAANRIIRKRTILVERIGTISRILMQEGQRQIISRLLLQKLNSVADITQRERERHGGIGFLLVYPRKSIVCLSALSPQSSSEFNATKNAGNYSSGLSLSSIGGCRERCKKL